MSDPSTDSIEIEKAIAETVTGTGEKKELEEKVPPSFNANTQVDSLESLREEAPEIYDQTMKSLAQSIIDDMKRHQERMKEIQQNSRI
jgi:hypothetical protein